ncbi:MAG: tetratricopeptide repeat protein [Thiobacillus sp.]
MKTLKHLFVVVAWLGSTASVAMDRLGMTEAEVRSMPPICIAKMTGGELAKQWTGMVGPDFVHVHHYCMGINYLSRAYGASNGRDRGFMLKNAHDNLMYMVKAASPSFAVMPDVYLNLGIVYRMRGDSAQAMTSFHKAIELNPRMARAYRELADSYMALRNRPKALEVVTDGLRHNPETRSLQRLYMELGGKLPYPEPVAKRETTPESMALGMRQNEAGGGEASIAPTAPASRADSVDAPANQSGQEAAPQPKIGSPSNPFCRFCPPE